MVRSSRIQDNYRLMRAVYRSYGAYHQHPVNIAIHAICVPLIILSIIGLLNLIPSPIPIGSLIPMVFISYYAIMCPRLLTIALLLFGVLIGLDQLVQSFFSDSYWLINVLLFIICWVMQFLGHRLEGNKPAFIEDRTFLVHGPFMAAILAFGHLFPRLIPVEMKS
jgi:uncharacterized membrane protein YGL010W